MQSVDMAGHNTSLFVLGVMILWFGWYGFNPGSQLAIITPAGSTYSVASAVANSAVTTSLSPAASGLTGLLLTAILLKIKTGKHHWDIMAMGNSTLAGLVAITAGCSTVYPWAAIVIGIVAGIIYPLASRLMILLKVGLVCVNVACLLLVFWIVVTVGIRANGLHPACEADNSHVLVIQTGRDDVLVALHGAGCMTYWQHKVVYAVYSV